MPFALTDPTTLQIIFAVVTLYIASTAMGLFSKPIDFRGKHCYVTGGSSGLGRALAKILVQRGAHVTIVARDLTKLNETEAELKTLASPSQIIISHSADLTSAESSARAVHEACAKHGGRAVDYAFLCAGFSLPRYFLDAEPEDLKKNHDGTYWTAAYTSHAIIKMMAAQRVKGSVVFVSSFLGYTTYAGYTPYSPGKYAVRGLADTLRSEMLLHDINIHIYMPGGIDSPGFVEEQRFKPGPAKKIEESDDVQPPEVSAGHLLSGLEKGYYQITSMYVTDLVRVTAKGAVPGNNLLMDAITTLISVIGVPIWRRIADYQVKSFKKEAQADLQKRGFYVQPAGSYD